MATKLKKEERNLMKKKENERNPEEKNAKARRVMSARRLTLRGGGSFNPESKKKAKSEDRRTKDEGIGRDRRLIN